MAKQAKVRPCTLVGVDPEEMPWQAYCLDRAVMYFGDSLTAELDSIEAKNTKEREGKVARILTKWLPDTHKPQFRDPARKTQTIS